MAGILERVFARCREEAWGAPQVDHRLYRPSVTPPELNDACLYEPPSDDAPELFPFWLNTPSQYAEGVDNPSDDIELAEDRGSAREARIRAALILEENEQDSVEALAQLFVDPRLDEQLVAPVTGNSASARLEFILRYVSGGLGIPLGPTARDINGSGLNPNLDDHTSDQINHFLTAVKLGYDPSFINMEVILSSSSASPNIPELPMPHSDIWIYPVRDTLGLAYNEDLERAAIRMIVGHELRPDPASILSAFVGAFSNQVQAATDDHIDLFLTALEAHRNGEDMEEYLAEIFRAGHNDQGEYYNPDDRAGSTEAFGPWGDGNSMEDLRLSVLGYLFGVDIRNGTIGTRADAAAWLREELK